MIHVLVLYESDDIITALESQTEPVIIHKWDKTIALNADNLLAFIKELPASDWISFINNNCIAYKNKYETLLKRSQSYDNVAGVVSDFETFNKATNKLEKILMDPYNIRAWPENYALPLDGLFSVKAIKDSPWLPDHPHFWKQLVQKYVFLHCPQSLHCIRV